MTVNSCGIGWGATIDAHPAPSSGGHTPARDVGRWTVELRRDPNGLLRSDDALERLREHATRLAPDAEPTCSLTLGGLSLVLSVAASDPHEAADRGEELFVRSLEAALWPRDLRDALGRPEVRVVPAGDLEIAA